MVPPALGMRLANRPPHGCSSGFVVREMERPGLVTSGGIFPDNSSTQLHSMGAAIPIGCAGSRWRGNGFRGVSVGDGGTAIKLFAGREDALKNAPVLPVEPGGDRFGGGCGACRDAPGDGGRLRNWCILLLVAGQTVEPTVFAVGLVGRGVFGPVLEHEGIKLVADVGHDGGEGILNFGGGDGALGEGAPGRGDLCDPGILRGNESNFVVRSEAKVGEGGFVLIDGLDSGLSDVAQVVIWEAFQGGRADFEAVPEDGIGLFFTEGGQGRSAGDDGAAEPGAESGFVSGDSGDDLTLEATQLDDPGNFVFKPLVAFLRSGVFQAEFSAIRKKLDEAFGHVALCDVELIHESVR